MIHLSRYFRISVTDSCNLSCFYCHKEGNRILGGSDLSPEEIQFACKTALEMGYKKFKITGGEPTIRQDICTIISLLSDLDLPDLSMITNGTNLYSLSQKLWDSGLKRMNVTLNTINEERFRKFQKDGTMSVKHVTDGIEKAIDVGFQDMKLNFIYFDEECDQDLLDLLKLANDYGVTLVVLPVIGGQRYFSLEDLYKKISEIGISSEEVIADNEGIKKRYIKMKSGANVLLRAEELFYQRPYVFCDTCGDMSFCREGIFPIRLSAKGDLIPCLASKMHHVPVREILENRDQVGLKNALAKINSWEVGIS